MKKADRIAAFVEKLEELSGSANAESNSSNVARDPHYRGFFQCFNEQRYYEAHDVLEHLWLQDRENENFAYFKGLIQIAGAFVHLQKQFLRPDHPKDGRRLRPAARLFHLGMKNIAPFRPRHMSFDVAALHALCEKCAAEIIESDFKKNPWHPERAPLLKLD